MIKNIAAILGISLERLNPHNHKGIANGLLQRNGPGMAVSKRYISIPGRIDRCALDKIELVLRAWRPAIGGRCSSVGSRLSTKQTYVYIGDADSATPASKYPPPWPRRGTSRSIYASQEQNALRGLIHPRENLASDFFFSSSFVLRSSSSSSSSFARVAPYPLFLFLSQCSYAHFHNRPLFLAFSLARIVVLLFVVATCQSKASHTSYRLVVS